MIGRNMTSIARGLAVAAVLGTSTLASAQEAIMLERIGAVRMATPEELQRATTAQGRSAATDQAPQAHRGLQRLGAAD